jgi:hypothetical protein
MVRTIGVAERRARLARRHRLLPEERTDDVVRIAEDLVALHSTDPVTVHLSVALRMRHPSIAALERALYEDRTLVRHHAMRRTLWVATPETIRLMHAAATRKLIGPESRRTEKLLAEGGLPDPAAWLTSARGLALDALREHGPMTARQVGERVPELRHPMELAPGTSYATTASAHTRVLLQLGFEGAVLRGRPSGSWVSGAYHYVATDSWLPEGLGDLDVREAAAELVGRWLRRFGPATTTDVQWWHGWTATTTRQALADAGAVPVTLRGGEDGSLEQPGWLAPDDVEEPGSDAGPGEAVAVPWVAALPSLDPTVMGWKERAWYLPAACADTFDRNGNAGPTLWVDGQVVGAWGQAPDGSLRTHWFVDVPAARRRQVDVELDRVRDLLGDTRVSVRFPGRIHARLLADP